MTKLKKLRICNWCLLVLTAAILASGIQLEATHCNSPAFVYIHIITGCTFTLLAAWHIALHFGKSNWFARIGKQKDLTTKILWWPSLAMLLTGIASTGHWIARSTHAPIGGIHGKIGFLMILLSIIHIARRIRFFKP